MMDIKISLSSYYSHGDERRFFEGLKDIPAIKSNKGIGRDLILGIDLRLLNKESVIELIALLWRYGVPLKPLSILSKRKRFEWLRDKRHYWYKSMF